MLVFEERGKPLGAEKRTIKLITHIWRWIWELNPSHIDGRWVLSSQHHPSTYTVIAHSTELSTFEMAKKVTMLFFLLFRGLCCRVHLLGECNKTNSNIWGRCVGVGQGVHWRTLLSSWNHTWNTMSRGNIPVRLISKKVLSNLEKKNKFSET